MKRKVDEELDIDVSSTDESDQEVDQGEEETVDVDFDFFNLNPDVDFHATKMLLRQLFGDDGSMFDVLGLADVILVKDAIGTTIKTDGKELDPFAMILVIDAQQLQPCVKQVMDYLVEKTQKHTEFNMFLRKLLAKDSKKRVAWIFSERLINMPVEVTPPLYKMLLEEMAEHDLKFDYFVIVSKIYYVVAAQIPDENKLKKQKAQIIENETDYFHYEDMVLEKHAKYNIYLDYTNHKQETDSRRVFSEHGIDPKLSVMLLDAASLENAVPEMAEQFPPF